MLNIKSEDEMDSIAYINTTINEIYAITEVKQTFTNTTSDNIELSIRFPINEDIQLNKFAVFKGEEIVISKVMDKEKANEKYTDSITEGNIGILSSYNENNLTYDVNIGNILPKEKIELISYFFQKTTSDDMSYEYILMQDFPAFSRKTFMKKIIGQITINANSKLTRLIFPFLNEKTKINSKMYSNEGKTCTIKFETKAIFKEEMIYNKNIDREIFLKNRNNRHAFFNEKIIPKPFIQEKGKNQYQNALKILFRTENMYIPILYSQYNPEKKQTAYSLNYIYSSKYIKNKIMPTDKDNKIDEDNEVSYYQSLQSDEINDNPGCFIFIVDQSGSMKGKPIRLVREALTLFMHSLNEGSYFQIIGFGSNFIKYNEKPIEYNKQNVSNILNTIATLNAKLGGTNIYSPLENIFSNNNDYKDINLAKNIFLLTDGRIQNREKCFELIKNSNSKFRIHSIGIGKRFDKILIRKMGEYGKGSINFVEDVNELNKVVINSLNYSSRPYIYNAKFENSIKFLHELQPEYNFTFQDEIINYSFITDSQPINENINIIFNSKIDDNDIKENLEFKTINKLDDGEALSQIIISNIINNENTKFNDEEKIKLSKEYQVLCNQTALFAEIKNQNSNQNGKLISIKLNQNQKSNIKNRPISHYNNNYNRRYNNYNHNYNDMGRIRRYRGGYLRGRGRGRGIAINNIDNYFNNNYEGIREGYNDLRLENRGNRGNRGAYRGAGVKKNFYMEKKEVFYRNIEFKGIKTEFNNINNFQHKGQNKKMEEKAYRNKKMNNFYDNMNNKSYELYNNNYNNNNFEPQTFNSEKYYEKKEEESYEKEEKNDINGFNDKINDEINDIVRSQDIMEGFWNEKNITKEIAKKNNDVYNKITNYVNNDDSLKDKINVIYTVLVIYYLLNYKKENFEEMKLIISKGKKYLKKKGCEYEKIIEKIKI